MSVAVVRPRSAITSAEDEIESAVKAIAYHALLLLIDDIRLLVSNTSTTAIRDLLDHQDIAIRSHAKQRGKSLKRWMKEERPLAWNNVNEYSGNYALLSMILCEDPDADPPTLSLSKKNLTYEALVKKFIEFATSRALQRQRIAPLTKDGGFQYVLPIATTMVFKLVPPEHNRINYWTCHLINMMKKLKIQLIPWHKDTPNAYATDLKYWIPIRPTVALSAPRTRTVQDRILEAAQDVSRRDPFAPWDVPERLADMKPFWNKKTLPECWTLDLASLPNPSSKSAYVANTYQFVKEHYDGQKWAHHFALIIAICFSRVAPNICIPNGASVTSDDSTAATQEIRNMPWVPAQSASHKGISAPLPFIVMVSTALIAFWDNRSPLSKHLASQHNVLGNPWTDKHGAFIHSFLLVIVIFSLSSQVQNRFMHSILFEWVWLLQNQRGSAKMPSSNRTGSSNLTIN